jgi:hypothetical protein
MMSDILKELEQIVTEVGKADKFTLILERSQILYSDQGIDITNKVIETTIAGEKNRWRSVKPSMSFASQVGGEVIGDGDTLIHESRSIDEARCGRDYFS